jgi:hypothetical protein
LKQHTWNAWRVKAGRTKHGSRNRAHLLHKGARDIAGCQQGGKIGTETEGRAGDKLPELAQFANALLSSIARDDRGVDSAD